MFNQPIKPPSPPSETEKPVKLLSDRILLRTFHPHWEMIDKKFWQKRVVIIICAAVILTVHLVVGYSWQGSVMPATFADPDEGLVHVVEFAVWLFCAFFTLELYIVARHKKSTTQIKYDISHNPEMGVSISFNRSFGWLFFGLVCYYLLKLNFRFILSFEPTHSNIFHYFEGVPLHEVVYAMILVGCGFLPYAQFIYVFERVVVGRKFPIFWIFPIVGLGIMYFVKYDILFFVIPLFTAATIEVYAYNFGVTIALLGGIIVPILYYIMGKRFEYASTGNPSLKQTSKDCRRKGNGFTLAAVGAIFNINLDLFWSPYGGLPFIVEMIGKVWLAPILTLAGILTIRAAYRPLT